MLTIVGLSGYLRPSEMFNLQEEVTSHDALQSERKKNTNEIHRDLLIHSRKTFFARFTREINSDWRLGQEGPRHGPHCEVPRVTG